MPAARDLIEHIERTISDLRADLEATVDRLDAATSLREMFFAADIDPDGTADEAMNALTANEVDRARFAALSARMIPEPKENER